MELLRKTNVGLSLQLLFGNILFCAGVSSNSDTNTNTNGEGMERSDMSAMRQRKEMELLATERREN